MATVTLVAAGFSARAGGATLEELRAGASVATLRSEQGVARLQDAEAHFGTARSCLDPSPYRPNVPSRWSGASSGRWTT
ncbi:MAG: hypothetical protein M3N32_10365 [Actinomycetota bacterium]|nr:hypothetical protein [Actinomycetota bacterium]